MNARFLRIMWTFALAVLALVQSAGARAYMGTDSSPNMAITRTFQATTLFRPIFTADRRFVIEAQADVDKVQDVSMPIEFGIFDDALKSCKLDLDKLHGQFALMLLPTSSVWQALDLIFPGSLARVKGKTIHLVIDDFSKFAGNSPEYASYFIDDNDGPVIGLDCSSQIAQSYWLPSLAHELTHAILNGQGDESWWEEALAQQIEHYVGGVQPDLSAGNLAQDVSKAGLPLLLDMRRPVSGHDEYGITYLFSKYILQKFGGWSTLRAMAQPEASPTAEATDFLTQLAAQGKSSLQSSGTTALMEPSMGADKLTRDGLLRYFYVALTLNDKNYLNYSIEGWQGIRAIPEEPTVTTLQPGQATVFLDETKLSPLNPKLESYRILIDASGAYQIIPITGGSTGQISKGFQPEKDYVLTMNLEKTPQALFLSE